MFHNRYLEHSKNLVIYNKKRMASLDTSAVPAAWDDLRDDKTATNWFIFGIENDKVLVERGRGTGGYDEFCNNLTNDEVLYGAFRVYATGSRDLFINIF